MRLEMQLAALLHVLSALPLVPIIHAATLTLQVPPSIPFLPPSTTAYLTAHNSTLHVPITRANTFVFTDLSASSSIDTATSASAATKTSYLLDIGCRDYDFAPYGVDVKSNGVVEIYRVARGGIQQGEKLTVGDAAVELRLLRARDFYEKRGGCTLDLKEQSRHEGQNAD